MSGKDKSLLLLLAAAVIIVWFIFYAFSSLATSMFSKDDNYKAIVGTDSREWLNLSGTIKSDDLENRVILLDFWTYACINCLHMVPEIKKLEEEFGSKLTVIGVHSGKFDNEKKSNAIKSAVIKYNISHPVVNDANFDIWKYFKVTSWPTLILLNTNGSVAATYIGEGNGDKMRKDIKKLIGKNRFSLNNDPLPIVLEKNKVVGHILKFPSKLEYVKEFEYKNTPKIPAIFIANSGANNVVVTSLKGEILLKIGSGIEGFEDGDLSAATFRSPRGLLYKNNILYVADTGNHALRKVDLDKNLVTTISGSGARGQIISEEIDAKKADLASPWDLEFFPDQNNIIIANAGTHQILKYDITKNTVSPFAGSGAEDIIDGVYPNNSLAQTSGVSVFDNKLYFVDSESSSLRMADKDGNVKTLIGSGLFKFGHENGAKSEALMQHPAGLYADDTGVYVADTFNNIIRKYDPASATIKDYGNSGVNFSEPEGIISVLNKFYIADTNNDRIIVIDRGTGNASLLDIMPALKFPKNAFLEYLPNLQTIPTKSVKSDAEITLSLELKKGWKLNEMGPSFFNLIEVSNDKEANLVASYDWNSVRSGYIKLPKLSDKFKYYLQGTIYYCEDRKNALCMVESYEQQLRPEKSSTEDQLKIDFIYN